MVMLLCQTSLLGGLDFLSALVFRQFIFGGPKVFHWFSSDIYPTRRLFDRLFRNCPRLRSIVWEEAFSADPSLTRSGAAIVVVGEQWRRHLTSDHVDFQCGILRIVRCSIESTTMVSKFPAVLWIGRRWRRTATLIRSTAFEHRLS